MVIDEYGDAPIRAGSSRYHVSIIERDPPLVRVWGTVLREMTKSAKLFEAINDANTRILRCRMFFHEDDVMGVNIPSDARGPTSASRSRPRRSVTSSVRCVRTAACAGRRSVSVLNEQYVDDGLPAGRLRVSRVGEVAGAFEAGDVRHEISRPVRARTSSAPAGLRRPRP